MVHLKVIQNHIICNWTMISTHYNSIGILVLSNLKIVMRVAGTCLWLFCNTITFINPSAFDTSFKNLMHGTWNIVQLDFQSSGFVHDRHLHYFVYIFPGQSLIVFGEKNAIQSLRRWQNKTDNQRRMKQKQQLNPLCLHVSHRKETIQRISIKCGSSTNYHISM